VSAADPRTILFDLDATIQQINRAWPGDPVPVRLTGLDRHLIRRWADA